MAAGSAPDPGRAGTLAAAGVEGRGAGTGAVAQDTRPSTAAIMTSVGVIREKTVMALLLLEALGALLILVFIVWWTMFSGRNKGELKSDVPREAPPEKPGDPL
jgi:hypothetical protein